MLARQALSERERCFGLVCVVKLVTFTEWDAGWLMHYEVGNECGLQITFYYSNTHTKMQIDGMQCWAAYLFDAVVNSHWFTPTWNAVKALLSSKPFPASSHRVSYSINRLRSQVTATPPTCEVSSVQRGKVRTCVVIKCLMLWTVGLKATHAYFLCSPLHLMLQLQFKITSTQACSYMHKLNLIGLRCVVKLCTLFYSHYQWLCRRNSGTN